MLRSTAQTLGPSVKTSHSLFRQCARHYSDLGASSSFPSQLPPPRPRGPTSSSSSKRKAPAKQGVPIVLLENRCAFVRTWDFLKNPAEALALIRAIEQKYGTVESFQFQKDFDSPSLYQAQVKITFRSVESFRRIPEDFETLHIRAPKVQPRRPGGIGLDEIHHLVSEDVEFLTADQVSEMASEERSIDFRVERAQHPYLEESPYRFTGVNQTYRKEVGTKMLEWGGFHEMKPIDSTRPITNEELTEEKLDHVHMRRALREWAQYLNVRNPYEIYPEEQVEDTRHTSTPKPEAPVSISNGSQEMDSQLEVPSILDEWSASDLPQPDTVREPIERILDMEDIRVTINVAVESEVETPTKDSPPEELATSVFDAVTASHPSVSLPDSTPNPDEPRPSQSSHDSSSLAECSTQINSQPTAAQVSLPPPPKPPKSKAGQAQLQEARRLGDLVRSSQKSKGTLTAKAKPKHKAAPEAEVKVKEEPKGESASPDLEANPRFGGLFNRLEGIFEKS